MTERDIRLLCAILFAVLVATVQIVSAQDDETVLVLAQSMVAESGWRAEEDHRAVAHVLRKRATQAGVPLRDMALRYVAIYRSDTDRARWVRSLSLDATRPDGWPSSLSWAHHVPLWRAVIALARAFVADPSRVPDPCPAAMDWGGAMDVPRGRMVRASCVGAHELANRFYKRGVSR